MKKISCILLTLSMLLAGCATPTQPWKIQAAYVSPIPYKDYSCDQIRQEMTNLSNRTLEIYDVLHKKSCHDGAKMFIGSATLPVTWFMMEGNGPEEAEMSQVLGSYKTLETIAKEKGYDLKGLPSSPDEILAQKYQEAMEDQREAQRTGNSVSRGQR